MTTTTTTPIIHNINFIGQFLTVERDRARVEQGIKAQKQLGGHRWPGHGWNRRPRRWSDGGEDEALQSPDKSVGRRVVPLGFGGGGTDVCVIRLSTATECVVGVGVGDCRRRLWCDDGGGMGSRCRHRRRFGPVSTWCVPPEMHHPRRRCQRSPHASCVYNNPPSPSLPTTTHSHTNTRPRVWNENKIGIWKCRRRYYYRVKFRDGKIRRSAIFLLWVI